MENIHNIVMSLQKKGGEGARGGMLSWLQPFLEGGRLVIHVMDSLDSLASAAECESQLAAQAERWHRLHGKVNTGIEPERRHRGCGDEGSAGGRGEQHGCLVSLPP